MTRRDFSRANQRDTMRRNGHEPTYGSDLFPALPRTHKPRQMQRTEADAMMSPSTMITKAIECRCGHKGRVKVPFSKVTGPFRCVKCGSRIEGRNG